MKKALEFLVDIALTVGLIAILVYTYRWSQGEGIHWILLLSAALAALVYLKIFWPDPEFVPFQGPFFYKSRGEARFFRLVSHTAFLLTPVIVYLNIRLDLDIAFPWILLPMGIVILSVYLPPLMFRFRVRDRELRRLYEKRERIETRSLVLKVLVAVLLLGALGLLSP